MVTSWAQLILFYRIEDSVKEDVALVSSSPFIRPGTTIVGLKLDIFTGVVTKVAESKVAEQ